jgi:uncharacterized protein
LHALARAGELDPGCEGDCCATTTGGENRSAWSRLGGNLWQIARRVSPYFVIGMALAAPVLTLLPKDAIPNALGGAGGVWVYLLAAVAGAPLYVCQGEEVPLTYALVATGVAPGPALTFLLGAVGMCLPSVVMSRGVLAPRVTYVYVAFWTAFAILSGVIFQTLTAS